MPKMAHIEIRPEEERTMSSMGKTAAASAHVAPPDAAPAVLATSRLCELMELAAARLLRPHLRPGESSVAVEMKLRHIAPQPGAYGAVRVVASHHSIEGRLHRFTVHAFDERGLVAVSEHTRALVNGRRFVARARRRAGKTSMLLEV
jgi:fluoroacetyl-CoA thioesterase